VGWPNDHENPAQNAIRLIVLLDDKRDNWEFRLDMICLLIK